MVIARHLRTLHLAALAEREIEKARAIEHDAPAEVQAAGGLRLLDEQHAQLHQALTLQPRARELGARAAVARAGVREVDEAVFGEARMQRNLEQATLPAGVDARHAFHVAALEVAPDEIQPAGALGDEHAPVGQEGERPGMVEPFHQLHHPGGLGADGQGEKQNKAEKEAHRRLS